MATDPPVQIIKDPNNIGNATTSSEVLNIWAMEARTSQFINRPEEIAIPETDYQDTILHNTGGGSLYASIRAVFFDLPSSESFVEGSSINSALDTERWIRDNFIPTGIIAPYSLKVRHVNEAGVVNLLTYPSMAMVSMNMSESWPRVRAAVWDIRMMGGNWEEVTTATP